jgi:hypothetical protein
MRGLLAIALVLLGSSCSTVQEASSCPGQRCPVALRRVGVEAARVSQVTSVDRAWRFRNVDRGASGGVDVHAAISREDEAKQVAAAISTIYRESGVDPVDHVDVLVVPDPERDRPEVTESVTGGAAGSLAAVACAGEGCAAEVAFFRDSFAGSAVAGEATLDSVSWAADDGGPCTRIEVTATGDPMDPAAFRDFEGRIVDTARAAGLTDIGDVRTLVHYRARVEFAFTFDTQESVPS